MSTKYYKKNKEILQKRACESYRNLSEEEKNKKCQNACDRYKNLSRKI